MEAFRKNKLFFLNGKTKNRDLRSRFFYRRIWEYIFFLYTRAKYFFIREMIQDILLWFFAFSFLLLPLVFWMYIFTSLFEYGVSRLYFLTGVITGWVLTCIFVFHEKIVYGIFLPDIFTALSQNLPLSYGFSVFLSISLFFIFWVGVSFFFQFSLRNFFYQNIISYLFLILLIVMVTGMVFFSIILFPEAYEGSSVTFGTFVFWTLGGIIAYYITLSFLEEVWKYITQLWFSWKKTTSLFQGYMIVSASVALGFSFFENIFYSYQYFSASWLSWDFLIFVLLRSIFSTTLHLLTSLLFSLGFWSLFSYLLRGKRQIYHIFFWTIMSIIVHAVFNIFLWFGFIGVLFLSVFWLYILLSFIFERQYHQW